MIFINTHRKFSVFSRCALLIAILFHADVYSLRAEEPLREVSITAAVSPHFKTLPGWKEEISRRFDFANKIFEPFHIHFSIRGYADWALKDENLGTRFLLTEISAFYEGGPNDIVIGFHKFSHATPIRERDTDVLGMTPFARGVILIRDSATPFSNHQRDVILTHELVHLFGGQHVKSPSAIMYPTISEELASTLDPDNSKIIKITRKIDLLNGEQSLSDLQIQELIQLYEGLRTSNPQGDFHTQLGIFYDLRDLHTKAMETLQEAVKADPENPKPHFEMGIAYDHSHQLDMAVKELTFALNHWRMPYERLDKADTLNWLGVVYYQKEEKEKAASLWREALALDPQNPDPQVNLASIAADTDSDHSIAELEKILVKFPGDVHLLGTIGMAYIKKKDYQKAAQYFYNLLEKHVLTPSLKNKARIIPQVPEFYLRHNLGVAYLYLHEGTRAIFQFEKVRSLNPLDSNVYGDMAEAYFQTHAYAAAVETVREGLKFKSNDPQLYAILGNSYHELGKTDEMIAAYQQAAQYATDKEMKIGLTKNIASAELNKKQYGTVIKLLEDVTRWTNQDSEAYQLLGYAYLQTKRYSEARHAYEKALQLKPSDKYSKEGMRYLDYVKKSGR